MSEVGERDVVEWFRALPAEERAAARGRLLRQLAETASEQLAQDQTDRVWRFIADFWHRSGFMPSHRDICDHFGWASTNASTGYLERLRERGKLDWEKGRPRSYRLLEWPEWSASDYGEGTSIHAVLEAMKW